MHEFIKKLNERRSALLEEIRSAITAAETEERDLTDDENASIVTLRMQIAELDVRIADLVEDERREHEAAEAIAALEGRTGAGVGGGRVTNEPTTYGRGAQHSFYRDLAHAHAPGGMADPEARERLQRHRQETDVELRSRPELEQRANMSRTDGTGGEFVPPLWLVDQYVPLARAGRVAADLCRNLPLPAGTDTITLPTVATGTAAAEQSDGSSVQKTDMTTSSVAGAVRTIAGQQVFAMQLLDQSPINFDEVVFADLISDLFAKLDVQVLNGTATNGKGLLQLASTISVSYTDASPTVPELYPKIADGDQQVHTNRFMPPQARLMHPRRWGWILASLDANSRPLVVPNAQGPQNAFAGMDDVRSEGSVGSLQGLPVYVDANIPTNLGGGTEDAIITARFDDLYLYEGALRSRVLYETDADTLSVRLQVWEYFAVLFGRYPKAIAKVTGTGLAAPTF